MFTLYLLAINPYPLSMHPLQEEGTLIGTALAICFGYWLGVASLLFFIAYVVNAHLSMVQVFSLTVRNFEMWVHILVQVEFHMINRVIPSADIALCYCSA